MGEDPLRAADEVVARHVVAVWKRTKRAGSA